LLSGIVDAGSYELGLLEKIGVVGAGMMGSEIALMFALAGHPTTLSDQERAQADKSLQRLHELIERGIVRGFWSAESGALARRGLSAVNRLDDHADRDLVIEAVFEDAELKRNVFARLDTLLPPTAGLASNTSSISITSLSSSLGRERRPRFVGTHFFSPVSRMKLVEVIPTIDSDPAFVDQVAYTLAGIGKTPIRVKDVVGFAVNRLLHALVIESIRLVEEGVCSPADIDAACKLGLGHPIGPFELLDNTANSLSQSVHEILHQQGCSTLSTESQMRQVSRI
jgi:3-hydroxybutyryl-CoA dehydrogenase